MTRFTENPVSRRHDIVVQELNGEILLYDLTVNKAFCLNETSALVWSLCDGDKSILEISRIIGKRSNDTVDDDLIWLAIDQLKQENLLSNGDRMKTFDSVTRREIIRKIGLASMIALPLVSSLTAPPAAMAASPGACGNTDASCQTNTDCCSNYCDCITQTCQPNPGGLGGCL